MCLIVSTISLVHIESQEVSKEAHAGHRVIMEHVSFLKFWANMSGVYNPLVGDSNIDFNIIVKSDSTGQEEAKNQYTVNSLLTMIRILLDIIIEYVRSPVVVAEVAHPESKQNTMQTLIKSVSPCPNSAVYHNSDIGNT